PRRLPPRLSTAHRARRQPPVHDHAVAAFVAAELSHRGLSCRRTVGKPCFSGHGFDHPRLLEPHRDLSSACTLDRCYPHTATVQTPEPARAPRPERRLSAPRPGGAAFSPDWGERIAWVAGLVLAISAFTGWYVGTEADGLTLSVTGWHTGALGKLVFFVGLATLILEALREAGIALPASVPESLVLIGLGSLATIFVLIRIISVPDTFFDTAGRGIGIFISLVAAGALIGAGLLRAAEEL